ncbi:hypothetical protein G6011_09400 [Alternaria panax]|uniref:Uncharacterized protein n=1 Tax=Alternaria panax TaxID=48097 RepID=A0AAD4IB90_9PLEO|nr:hypothetical protein G6011_09400 [Alternaria panax]
MPAVNVERRWPLAGESGLDPAGVIALAHLGARTTLLLIVAQIEFINGLLIWAVCRTHRSPHVDGSVNTLSDRERYTNWSRARRKPCVPDLRI